MRDEVTNRWSWHLLQASTTRTLFIRWMEWMDGWMDRWIDWQPRNSCRQLCCAFMTRAASGCRWNETSAGDDQRQTEDDSRQQDTSGAAPASDWCTSPAILNATRWRTGSQWSCRNAGVMWSLQRAPVTRRADVIRLNTVQNYDILGCDLWIKTKTVIILTF